MQTELNPNEFYTGLASDYDTMTGFDQRLQKDRPALEKLVRRYKLTSVLDIGCGTGVHSIILASLGVRVTAADPNTEMLRIARENADRYPAWIRFVNAGFVDLNESLYGGFDGIVCLGNSLPHILTDPELHRTFRTFHQLLLPGGILLIQNLNYDDILKRQPPMINQRQQHDMTITRSYEYGPSKNELIRFRVQRSRTDGESDTIATRLRPWRREELLTGLETTEFAGTEFYGNLEMEPYDENGLPNLVILAKKAKEQK